jgi:hypothetical protein
MTANTTNISKYRIVHSFTRTGIKSSSRCYYPPLSKPWSRNPTRELEWEGRVRSRTRSAFHQPDAQYVGERGGK